MLIPPLPRLSLSDARGFTLVETLVAMITGVVVTGALFAILDVSVKQSSRISEVSQSTQLGRGTMTRIQDALHSACISPGFAPVREGSKETKLVLISAYSEQAEVPATWTTREVTEGASKKTYLEGVRRDEIVFEGNNLNDTYALSTGTGAEAGYSFGTGKLVKIGEHITQIGVTPIFQYYEYNSTAQTSTSAASTTLVLKKPPPEGFKKEESAKIAAVAVSFNTEVNDSQVRVSERKEHARTADLTSSTTFAFTAPDAEAAISAGPCE
jgi:type II secretory pathway pseudopilin PulG